MIASHDVNSHWIDHSQRNAAAPVRLFCFPHAGGGRMAFRDWSAVLPEVDVCPVLLPGRDFRLMEKPFERVETLIPSLANALPLDKPFAFLGHSMGALVSFELARELRRRRTQPPIHLFVAAHAAPQVRETRSEPRHLMSDEALLRELQLLNGTAGEVLSDASLMQLFLPVLRADFALLETYTYLPEEPLACPITAFGGESDGEASRDQLLAWKAQTRSRFELLMFPGSHFFLHEFRPYILRAITREISKATHSYSADIQ